MTYIHKLRINFPDGSSHEMLPQGYSDSFYLQDQFYRVRFDGVIENCNSQGRTGSAMTYYSDDGSYLRLVFSYDNDWDHGNNTWTLYFPDGSKVTGGNLGGGNTQKIYDRNGNYVEGLTDQLNRSVTSSTDSNGDHFTVKGVDGQNVTWTVKWKDIMVRKTYRSCEWTCPENEQRSDLIMWFTVVDTITEPSQMGGRTYVFSYNAHQYPNPPSGLSNGWGEVSQVLLPSRTSNTEDAKITYEYDMDGVDGPDDDMPSDIDVILNNFPDTKTVTHDGEGDIWHYSLNQWGGSITAPDGSGVANLFYDTRPTAPSWATGLTYKTEYPDGSKVEKVWAKNSPQSACSTRGDLKCNPYLKAEWTSIKSGGSYTLTSGKVYTLDKNGNTTQIDEYDWMPYSTISRTNNMPNETQTGITSYLKRRTVTAYYNDTPEASTSSYTDADSYYLSTSKRLLRLVKSIEVQDASSTPKSRTEVSYDYTNYDSSNTKGGNVTETKSWDSFKGGSSQPYSNPLTTTNSITTSATYNSYGMPTQTTDANGVQTTITYGCITGPSGCVYDLYPTQSEAASNYSGVKRTSSAAYDFYTGIVTSATDNDNSLTNVSVYDDLGRPLIVKSAYNTSLESWTQYTYNDAGRYVIVKSDIAAKEDAKKVATTFFDQLGRPRLSKVLEDASTQSATNETDGIKVETKYKIDATNGFSYQLTSNPYRTTSDATMGWTRSKAWSNGQQSQVETFSGSSLPAPWGSNSASTGVVDSQIDANVTTVTDQTGKVRRSITDGLGRLTRVDEPTTSGLGTVSSPNQDTIYSYDILNNLLTVTQGSQTRTFTYSSMSRLLTAANPESGTISYVYDNNGNLTSKTDARSIVTSYTYDALNRVTQRGYAAPSPTPANYQTTPTVTYTYDDKTYAKGRLTKVSSSVSATEYTSFDILGRVTGHKQTIDSNDYTTAYTYNLAAQLLTETYPSGRMVQNTFASNGDLSQVQTKPSGGSYTNRASSFVYNAAGAVQSFQLGSGKYETTQFNPRLQPTQIGLGTSTTDTSLLKLEYGYGTTQNNGNVVSQTITVPGMTYPLVQGYTYDELNRLASAAETSNLTQTWTQVLGYDRYGNRNITSGTGQTSLTFNASNNHITTTGYSYDSAGNTIADPSGKSFTYDAENKQVLVMNGSRTQGTYYYDGDGKRVKKTSRYDSVIFVYDAAGRLIEERSSSSPYTLQTSYVYAGGRLLSKETEPSASTTYMTADHLGSPRINTDGSGNVVARHDYHPFGEEIDGSGGRTTGLGYQADGVRKQFTGYERDGETGLDFAQARMYAKGLGRFSSTDPMGHKKAFLVNPQNFNRYIYTRNSPLTYVDSNGLCSVPAGLQKGQVGICVEAFIASPRLPGKRFLGKGDNRTHSATEDLSFKVRTHIIVTPQPGTRNHNINAETTVGTSRVMIPIVTFLGDKNPEIVREGSLKANSITNAATTSGTLGFTLNVSATNGFPNFFLAPSDPIDHSVNFTVTPDNKVGLAPGGTRDGYPSIGIYSYEYVNGKLVTTVIYEDGEGHPDDLAEPMEKAIPKVKPRKGPQ